MAGAILSTGNEAPKKLARFIRFNVPLLAKSEFQGREVDLLLLAWALLLYRYSNGNPVEFTWGRNGTGADFTFDFSSSSAGWSPAMSLTSALETIEKSRQEVHAGHLVDVDNAIVFFNDECAPRDLSSNARVSDGDALGGGMAWVSFKVTVYWLDIFADRYREIFNSRRQCPREVYGFVHVGENLSAQNTLRHTLRAH